MIDIQISVEDEDAFPDRDRIARLCSFVADSMDLPTSTELSIIFVDDESMRSLNRQYRGIDRTTDVLSFECDGVNDGFPNGQGSPLTLGDIVLSWKAAARQAEELGHSAEEEVDLLMIHGILHLCGYDHISDEDAAVMEPLQDGLLARWRTSAVHRRG